jgi:hypothetical protein
MNEKNVKALAVLGIVIALTSICFGGCFTAPVAVILGGVAIYHNCKLGWLAIAIGITVFVIFGGLAMLAFVQG